MLHSMGQWSLSTPGREAPALRGPRGALQDGHTGQQSRERAPGPCGTGSAPVRMHSPRWLSSGARSPSRTGALLTVHIPLQHMEGTGLLFIN